MSDTTRRSTVLRVTIGVFAALVLLRLFSAALVPISEDEAYYIHWGRALDFGYFDHPPFVAWLGATGRLVPSSPFVARIGTMVAEALALPFLVGLVRRAGIEGGRPYTAALLLSNFNFLGLLVGGLVMPDVMLVTAWCAALHESAAALDGKPRRWLTAGAAVGVGLLSKYIMVLIGPVLLWGILRSRPAALRTPWPWLGGIVALLVFSPHLVWNARNDWVPIRFQIHHGAMDTTSMKVAVASVLPHPLPQERAPAPEKSAVLEVVRRTSEFAGGLVVVWGALFVPVVLFVYDGILRKRPPHDPIKPHLKPLLRAAAWIPILFFALWSPFTSIEANWPAVYVIGASVLLAWYCATHLRIVWTCSAINMILIILLVLYAHDPRLATRPDRVLKETVGHRDLADFAAELDGPILVARHQTLALMSFYRPDLTLVQWPGITSNSEYVRRREWNPWTIESLHAAGGFWLINEVMTLPRWPGFEITGVTHATACIGRGLVLSEGTGTHDESCPGQAIHSWYVVRYTAVP